MAARPLTTLNPGFAALLGRLAVRREHVRCFPARNFLLDESVGEERWRGYLEEEHWEDGREDASDWAAGHTGYLEAEVFLDQQGSDPPTTLNPEKTDRCPATFRSAESFTDFGRVHRDLDLVRVLDVPSLSRLTRRPVSELVEWGRAVVEQADEAEAVTRQKLEAAIRVWNRECDLRPVYTGFLADHEDVFGERLEDDAKDWADRLRDRLGLAHYDPAERGEIPVFVFTYPVSAVPTTTLGKDLRPLAVPTVLDGEISFAFCPAPRNPSCGQTVHLEPAAGEKPSREVVHPFLRLSVDALFRVGVVKKEVSKDLWPARREHLLRLRELFGRPDYAADTDSELDGGGAP